LGESPRESSFALDFSGGVWLGRRIGLGLRLGGWTIEGFDLWNPEEGESLSELFAVLAFHPGPDHPLSLALESGRVSYTVNDPSRMLEEGDGLGWRVAGSWRFLVSDHVALSPSLFLSWGKIDPDTGRGEGFEYTATGISLRVGWVW
jgi:hypothetical protein